MADGGGTGEGAHNGTKAANNNPAGFVFAPSLWGSPVVIIQ